MNKLLESIFKYYKPDFEKLRAYGFRQSNGAYFYNVDIMGGKFALEIKVTDADVDTTVIDSVTNEPYTLFLADGANGSFIGAIRTAYENVLRKVAENCFCKCVFNSDYAVKLIEYVSGTYGNELEFLWEKFPDYAIWRRADNKKWYGILLIVPQNKLGLPSSDRAEIINLRINPDVIDTVVDGKTVFRGYHMNKKHWVSICLDERRSLEEIKKLLDESYSLAKN